MARKQPVEDRDVLKFKFQALQDYISHHERKLDQFQIDLGKAVVLRDRGDSGGSLDRVVESLLVLYSADPSTSLIDADLADARAEVDAAYDASPEWAEIKGHVIKSGLAEVPIEAGFDSMLTYEMTFVIDRLNKMGAGAMSAADGDELVDEVFELMRYACGVCDAALGPAQHLCRRWLDALNSRTPTPSRGSVRKARRGRPKDEGIALRNRKMQEAWLTGRYKTYTELGDAFRVAGDVARKAVRPILRKIGVDSDIPKKQVK